MSRTHWTKEERLQICHEALKIVNGGSKRIPVPFARGMLVDTVMKAQLCLPKERRRDFLNSTLCKFVEDFLLDEMTKPDVAIHKLVKENPEAVDLLTQINSLEGEINKKAASMVTEVLMSTPLMKEAIRLIAEDITKGILANLLIKGDNAEMTRKFLASETPAQSVQLLHVEKPEAQKEVTVHRTRPRVVIIGFTGKQVAAIQESAPYVEIENVDEKSTHKPDRFCRKFSMADMVLMTRFTPRPMKDEVHRCGRQIFTVNNTASDVVRVIEEKYGPKKAATA